MYQPFRVFSQPALTPFLFTLFVALASGPAPAAEISGFSPMVIEQVSLARQLSMLRAICDQGEVAVVGGNAVCKVCPSYTSEAGDTVAGPRINNVIEGNFTGSDIPEALVDLEGCEPHAKGYGGAVVLEHGKDGWQRKLYRAGFRPAQCITFRTLQRVQALACNMVDTAQGVQLGELQWIQLHTGRFRQTTLVKWLDNTQSNSRRLVSVFPHRFMKADFNQDGRVDLRVSFRLRDEPVPEKYGGSIDAIGAGYRFPEPRTLQLIYLFDGNTLTLLPESAAAKQTIERLVRRIESGD